jgi:hypothetical protein
MELQTHKTLDEIDQHDIMDRLRKWRGIAEQDCAYEIERMIRNQDFAAGYQWDLTTKAAMEDKGKFVGTVNIIGPQMDQMVGNVVANPKDITCVNTHGGMREIADLNSALLKHAIESNDGLNLMQQWFHRGAESRRGFLAWFRDYSRDPVAGDLIIRLLPETDCLWDPTCKSYNFNGTGPGWGDGAKFFFFDDWVDRDWADNRWPGVKEMFAGSSPVIRGVVNDPMTQDLYNVPAREGEQVSALNPETQPDYSQTRYRLTHCWWMDWKECWYWYDMRDGLTEPVICVSRRDISLAKAATKRFPDQYRMIRSTVRICNHTIYIGTQLLENWVDEFDLGKANMSSYPVVQYCPKFVAGRAESVVECMIGPQETFNWERSWVVNALKMGPNSGWKIGKDIQNYSQVLREHTGEPGQIIDLEKCGGLAERIEPPLFQAGLHELSLESKMEIREVSNIRTESPEADTEKLSGRAILAKQAGAATGISPKLAMFDWSMRIFGQTGIDIIRCSAVYSDSEIKRMIEESRLLDDNILHEVRTALCMAGGKELPQQPPLPNPMKLQNAPPNILAAVEQLYQEEFEAWQSAMEAIDRVAKPAAIQQLIDAARNPIAGRYHTTVSLSPYSATSRLTRLVSVAETNTLLTGSGYQPLPERDILEASDIPNKARVMRERGYM